MYIGWIFSYMNQFMWSLDRADNAALDLRSTYLILFFIFLRQMKWDFITLPKFKQDHWDMEKRVAELSWVFTMEPQDPKKGKKPRHK